MPRRQLRATVAIGGDGGRVVAQKYALNFEFLSDLQPLIIIYHDDE